MAAEKIVISHLMDRQRAVYGNRFYDHQSGEETCRQEQITDRARRCHEHMVPCRIAQTIDIDRHGLRPAEHQS